MSFHYHFLVTLAWDQTSDFTVRSLILNRIGSLPRNVLTKVYSVCVCVCVCV